jgi:hypothetical protein
MIFVNFYYLLIFYTLFLVWLLWRYRFIWSILFKKIHKIFRRDLCISKDHLGRCILLCCLDRMTRNLGEPLWYWSYVFILSRLLLILFMIGLCRLCNLTILTTVRVASLSLSISHRPLELIENSCWKGC